MHGGICDSKPGDIWIAKNGTNIVNTRVKLFDGPEAVSRNCLLSWFTILVEESWECLVLVGDHQQVVILSTLPMLLLPHTPSPKAL